ncbi:MAG: endo-1,4-beta-xylanase [Defluviitaleaceae bacterium]|nr:endo-1,4-beta-xylanase [Defluviitaleaceae bacterium]
MKKTIVLIILLVFLSACGQTDTHVPPTENPQPESTAAPTPTPSPSPTPEPTPPPEPDPTPTPPLGWQMDLPSLSEAFAPYFLFGNIYSSSGRMTANDTNTAFLHHFNAVTAENWHKPDAFNNRGFNRPEASAYNFRQSDTVVDWAVANDLTLVGHALVWHSQSPDWLYFSAANTPRTRAEARENMEFHIRTLSEHYAARGQLGAFYAWDVVNEAIASGGGSWTGDWRRQLRQDSPWLRAYENGYDPDAGEHPSDYIYDAFTLARRYFPYSILYYNDYNEEIPAKRNAIAQMVEELNERWAHDFTNNPDAVPYGGAYEGRLLVEGIGLQSHMHLDQWRTNLGNVREALERFAQTGARLSVTELDITIGGQGGRHPDTLPTPLPREESERQAAAFARVFGYYLEFADAIERVTVWGKADNQSWRAWGHPLLFDHLLHAKPSYFAVLDAANAATPAGTRPVIDIDALPSGRTGEPFSGRITFTQSSFAPTRFSVTEGELPPGLTLFTTTGVIGGFPTQAGVFTFTVTAANAFGTDETTFTVTIG